MVQQNQNNTIQNNRPVPVAARREPYDFGPAPGLVGSDVDIQVSTAKRFPRSIGQAKQRAVELATLDQETAASCIYAVPRAGKIIEGPSTRLAEIIATAWGNLRIAAKTVGEDDGFTYAQAVGWDLETNVAISYETKRRITNREGERFGDDMIMTTSNAATSIALRNVVFRVIPRAYVNEVYEAARKTAAGSARTLKQRRTEMLQYFESQGVTKQQVFDLLNVAKVDDVTLDNLMTLRAIATTIKEGVASVQAIFRRDDKQPEAVSTDKNTGTDSKQPQAGNAPSVPETETTADKIVSALCELHPGDTIESQAAKLKTLKYIFGKTQLDEIVKLPAQIIEAGLQAMKSQTATAEANGDDIPI